MSSKIFSGLIACLALCITGCESSIKEQMADAPPKSQEFEGSLQRVYFAAQRAFKRLDFVLIRSSLGRIEAASSIHRSEVFGNSRQLSAKVLIRDAGSGKCVVGMTMTEDVAGDRFGGTYRKPLPEHDFYSLYFTTLQQVLSEQGDRDELDKK